MKKLSEELVWKSLKEGNLEAYGIIFKNYYSPLYNYGLKITRNEQFTEDSLQDFFLYIYEHREQLSDLKKLKPYLFVSFRNFIIRALKKEKNTNADSILSETIADIEFSIEELLIQEESSSINNKNLARLLNTLPKKQKEILFLKYYSNLKTSDIASILDINYQSVVNSIHKSIKSIREEAHILKLFKD